MKWSSDKKLKNKNKGMTLIEVIVSLLILAVIFTPMIMTFVRANRANQVAKTENYGTNLAESVIEAVKLLGIEGTALQFYDNSSPDNFKIAKVGSVSDYMEVMDDEAITSVSGAGISVLPAIVDSGTEKVFNKRGTVPYVFKILNAKEGTADFDVKVTISTAGYTDAVASTGAALGLYGFDRVLSSEPTGNVNNFKFSNLPAFDAKRTALINPSTAGTATGFDTLAKTFYWNLYESYRSEKFADYCTIIDTHNNNLWVEYYKALDRGEAAIPPTDLQWNLMTFPEWLMYNDVSLSSEDPLKGWGGKPTNETDLFRDRLYKTTYVDITKTIVDGRECYLLDSYIEYNFKQEGVALLSDDLADFPWTCRGYCNNTEYVIDPAIGREGINSIFFMYTPLNVSSVGGVTFGKEKFVISYMQDPGAMGTYSAEEKMRIYLAVQGDATDADNGTIEAVDHSRLKIETAGDLKSKLYFYSNSALDTPVGTPTEDTLISDDALDIDRLYTVKIDVYSPGTTELITSLSSTVVNTQ